MAGLAAAFARGAMTNNWNDIGNATLVIAMGANPSENHPACMAHVNIARRDPGYTWTDRDGNTFTVGKPKADLIVIDPRQTRTALQADKYIRIRPGTDIAFINGVINYIIGADPTTPTTGLMAATKAGYKARWEAYHSHGVHTDAVPANVTAATASRTLYGDKTVDTANKVAVTKWPKYTDATFKVVAASASNADYKRKDQIFSTETFYSLPEVATSSASAYNMYDSDTVFSNLKAHVAPYTLSRVADICDCSTDDIVYVANAIIENSRCASVATKATDPFSATTNDPKNANYRATTFLYAMGITQHTCGSANVRAMSVLQTLMGNMGRAGGGINALRGIHNVQGSTDMGLLYHLIPGYSGNPGTTASFASYMDSLFGDRLTVKDRAFIEVGDVRYEAKFGGTAGNDIQVQHVKPANNATLSVDVVKAATKTNIVVNLKTSASVIESTVQEVIDAVNAKAAAFIIATASLKSGGNAAGLAVEAALTAMSGGAVNTAEAYNFGKGGLQQKGFWNMTKAFFGDSSWRGTGFAPAYTWASGYAETPSAMLEASGAPYAKDLMDGLFALWPKGNGDNHIKMFRKMGTGAIKAAVVWGQNPAVTEPNQSYIRKGLKELDTLVCVDMFANETAQCDRKDTGVTYLIPACSHVEEAGSATNSGRVLQWRYQARPPAGNSKTDIELLLTFAKALSDGGAFAHITNKWSTMGAPMSGWTDAYAKLFANQYGWTPGDAFNCETVASKIYKQMCAPLNAGGTLWIYLEAWDVAPEATQPWSPTAGTPSVTMGAGTNEIVSVKEGATVHTDWTYNHNTRALTAGSSLYGKTLTVTYENCTSGAARGAEWPKTADISGTVIPLDGCRAKSRRNRDIGIGGITVAATPSFTAARNGNRIFKNWGYSWLVNRRVLYTDGDLLGDQTDNFQGPELVARMFTSSNANVLEYGVSYRTIHGLKDMPKNSTNTVPSFHVLPGRFPAHTEPYETPRADWETYGKNTTSNSDLFWGGTNRDSEDKGNLAYEGTEIGTPATYPLVLTTIRCVEHFQGGPITRNNWHNVELEPEPWVEINKTDARLYGIKDGDYVKIVTARTEPFVDGKLDGKLVAAPASPAPYPRAFYGKGFRARVGVGLDSQQRVGPGVVAIPWHWGETGLSTGSRANDLCIDAMDANTGIPESKACLCRIEKM